jgi:isocitrate dehydrogenase
MYWAQALAAQTDDAELAASFKHVAEALTAGESDIVAELVAVQGSPCDVGGYYRPNDDLASAAMRPSATFNAALELLG